MALVGYARVSTVGQSLDTQLQALAECSKIFQEKVSGASDDRPQLALLLDGVNEGDVVMVTKLDRLARNTRHLLEISDYLQHRQVALRILNLGIDTSTPTGKLMLTMIGAIATFCDCRVWREKNAAGEARFVYTHVDRLVLGGAVGNLVDRLVNPPSWGQGHVTDFLAYGDLFVGNVADVFVVAGVGLVCLNLLTQTPRTTAEGERTEEAS